MAARRRPGSGVSRPKGHPRPPAGPLERLGRRSGRKHQAAASLGPPRGTEARMLMKAVPVLLFAGATAFVSSSKLRDVRAENAAAKIPVVTIRAKDFSFVAPASIAAGQTTFRLVNDGKELHHITIIKLAAGKTIADYEAAIKNPGPPPAWATGIGGPNAAGPGGTVEATLTLEA